MDRRPDEQTNRSHKHFSTLLESIKKQLEPIVIEQIVRSLHPIITRMKNHASSIDYETLSNTLKQLHGLMKHLSKPNFISSRKNIRILLSS